MPNKTDHLYTPPYLKIAFIFACLVSTHVMAQTLPDSFVQGVRVPLAKLVGRYDAKEPAMVYVRKILERFEKGQVPEQPIKRTVGLAISLEEDCLPAANTKACAEPIIFPAMILQEDDRIAVTALRPKSDNQPVARDKEGYVEQFIAGDLGVGKTREFQFMLRQTVPDAMFGPIKSNLSELVVVDRRSISFIRQQGPWLLAVSRSRIDGEPRTLIYAFPDSISLSEEDKIFGLLK